MFQNPIISVYITNRNYGVYLEDAIQSVLKQTFKKIELIIIDDSSTDLSKKIIKKYEDKKLCRAIYNNKQKGLIKSSNIAIKAAKGKFVLRLDADDYLDRNALSIFLNAINKDANVAIVYSDYYLIDNKKNLLSLEKQISRKESLSNDKPVLAACCLIRKTALFSVNLYDERFSRQDGYDIWYKLIKNFKFKHISLPLFYYRRHEKNLTKNQSYLFKTRTKILRKFAQKKKRIINLKINCVIPVRGPNIDKFCNSLEIINKKPLICHTIDEALKVSEFKKIIITTSDKKLIIFLKKIYKKKIFYHNRSLELSKQNFDFRESVTSAVIKFNTLPIDILVIMTIENPFRKYFYLQQAISNLIIHDSDLVIGAIPDLDYNYYQYSKIGIRLISNQKNQKLKLEKNVILKDVGSFSVYRYNSYINNSLKKITNVILDDKHAFMINNKADLTLAKKINHNK
jgi:glycosyltransferase involved in cell wall biosynthesis